MKKTYFFLYFFLLFSCSNPELLLRNAQKLTQKGQYKKAESHYLTIIVRYPENKYVVEAKYKLGLLYKDWIKDYTQANMWFLDVYKNYKNTEFSQLAEIDILESPDYIGCLDNNFVILGDIESNGKNMKISTEYKKLDYGLYSCLCRIYAGEKLIRQQKKFLFKENFEIRESNVEPKKSDLKNYSYTILLKYPYDVGKKWETIKEDKQLVYTIVDKDFKVNVKNKTFENCLKVMETYKGSTGIRYLYYAPNKGCVKITTSALKNPKQEFSVLEIIE